MKKSLILFMALILGISMLAGCGGGDGNTTPPPSNTAPATDVPGNTDSPAESTPEPTPVLGALIEEPYFSLNEAAGWVFESNSGYLTMIQGDEESYVEMCIYTMANSTTEEELENALFFEGAEQKENVTYNGIEYLVVERADMPIISLITVEKHTVKSAFDGGTDYQVVMTVELYEASLEDAAPVLNTLKFNEKKLDVEIIYGE